MREQVKQVLKNAVYRTIGETASAIRAVDGDGRTLRVLMYHKVNDLPNNRMSMPVSLFDEQLIRDVISTEPAWGGRRHLKRELLRQLAKVIALRHEVGLAVHLD